MEFSWRFSNHMLGGISGSSESLPGCCLSSPENNNSFSKFICVPINKDTIEIPCFCRHYVEEAISRNVTAPSLYNYKKVVMPLYIHRQVDTKKTGDAIVTSLFDTFMAGVKKVFDGKGNAYYGNKGFIMDSNFTPLLMTEIIGKINTEGIYKVSYTDTIVRINPIVFDRTDCTVEKMIVKKLINLYTMHGADYIRNVNSIARDERTKMTARVIIEEFNHFIVTPVTPTISTFDDASLNNLLVYNICDLNDGI